MNEPSTVHRFGIDLLGSVKIAVGIPSRAKLVFFGRAPSDQTPGQLSVWFHVPTHSLGGRAVLEDVERTFEVQPTGAAIEPGREHRGSVVDGEYVWHLFEVTQ